MGSIVALAFAASALPVAAAQAEQTDRAVERITLIEQRIEESYALPIDRAKVLASLLDTIDRLRPAQTAAIRACVAGTDRVSLDDSSRLRLLMAIYPCVERHMPVDDDKAMLMRALTEAYLAALDGDNKLYDLAKFDADTAEATPEALSFERRDDVAVVAFAEMRTGIADRLRERLVTRREPARILVLDLRSNAGGSLDEIVLLASIVMERGAIFATRGKHLRDTVRYEALELDERFEGAVVVIVGPQTAAGAEILAAALQDNRRALVVGEPSMGRGHIRTLYPLSRTEAVALVTAQAFRPDGRAIEGIGVTPDCRIPAVGPAIVEVAIGVARDGIGSCPGAPDGDKGAPHLQ